MQSKRIRALVTVAGMAIAFGGLATATQAGASTYAVEVAPNGGVGGCQSSTGSMSNVTYNTGATAMTIYCPTPNGFAWGRLLDTPDEATDAALVDDGSEVAASWKQTGSNNSRGRKLGLLMRIGDMRVKNTNLVFEDVTDGTFAADYDLLPNGKVSKRPNLSLRLPKGADLLDGTVRCKAAGESAGVKWTAGASNRGRAYRAYTPEVVVDCSSLVTPTSFASNFASTTPSADSAKLMTLSANCPAAGQTAIAGGYDIAGSTTSQWPNIVTNGPTDAGTGWKVTVAVPSQNSSAAKANLKVWVTCKG